MLPIQTRGGGKFLLASFTSSITLWPSSDPLSYFNTHMFGKFANRQELRLPFLSKEILDLQGLSLLFMCVRSLNKVKQAYKERRVDVGE
jgi:hypothetical protein